MLFFSSRRRKGKRRGREGVNPVPVPKFLPTSSRGSGGRGGEGKGGKGKGCHDVSGPPLPTSSLSMRTEEKKREKRKNDPSPILLSLGGRSHHWRAAAKRVKKERKKERERGGEEIFPPGASALERQEKWGEGEGGGGEGGRGDRADGRILKKLITRIAVQKRKEKKGKGKEGRRQFRDSVKRTSSGVRRRERGKTEALELSRMGKGKKRGKRKSGRPRALLLRHGWGEGGKKEREKGGPFALASHDR